MKKHIAPNQVFISLFTFSMLSLLYSASAVNFEKSLSFWSIALLVLSLICLIKLVFVIKYTRESKARQADEYTTALLHRAGYYTYITVAFLISMLFIVVNVFMLLNRSAVNLESFLNVKVILGVIAIVQLIGSAMFVSYYYYINKKGECKNETKQ